MDKTNNTNVFVSGVCQIGPFPLSEPGKFPVVMFQKCGAASLIEGTSLEDLFNQLCADSTKNYLLYNNFWIPSGQIYECTDFDQIQSGGWVGDPNIVGNYMCDTC